MNPAADAVITTVLPPLVADLRAALGDGLTALYLYGSVVSGGFVPGVSDIDLVAVVEGPVEELDVAALDAIHRCFTDRDSSWGDRLEIVYVARASVGQPTRRDPVAVISPGEPFHLSGPSSDWLANWYLVRENGVALVGAPPAQVIGPVSHDAFLGAIRAYLRYLVTVDWPGYAVLSACRAVCTLATYSQCSKQEGAAWVRQRTPDWAWLIDVALEERLSPGAAFKDEQSRRAAREFVELLSAGGPPSASGLAPSSPQRSNE